MGPRARRRARLDADAGEPGIQPSLYPRPATLLAMNDQEAAPALMPLGDLAGCRNRGASDPVGPRHGAEIARADSHLPPAMDSVAAEPARLCRLAELQPPIYFRKDPRVAVTVVLT